MNLFLAFSISTENFKTVVFTLVALQNFLDVFPFQFQKDITKHNDTLYKP